MTMDTTLPISGARSVALTPRAQFQSAAVAICLAGMGVIFCYLLQGTGGLLNYTLDDPYIHLALAENLVQGHYGVNAGEYASPSSSILYPFLVAVTLVLGFGEYGPLVLNLIGAAGSAWILSGLFWDALGKTSKDQVSVVALIALPFLLLSVNGYGLGFTGMEHTLHVWASLAIIRGLILMVQTSAVPWFLLLACIAAPLLRFEGAALAGSALLAICLHGHWLRGMTASGVLVAILAAYVSLMASLGLPLMPSSVMVKSAPTAAFVANRFDAIAMEILAALQASLADRQGRILAGLVVLVLLGTLKSGKTARTVAYVAAAAGVAHLLAGRWDWFSRYEIYIIATLIAANLHVWAPVIGAASRRITTPGLLIFVFPVIGYTYLMDTVLTPKAARNIYEQQFQMHRFATDYFPEPVAVIDLGWVTFDNDQYVLDLWGLGNETARKLFNAQGRTPEPIRQMTSDAGVTYAMIYDEVFYEGVPAEWCLIGQLETPQLTASFATVELFLIDRTAEGPMRDAIAAFGTSLPERVSLRTYDC